MTRIVSLLLEKLKTMVMRFFFGGRGLGIGGIKINNNKKKNGIHGLGTRQDFITMHTREN